MDKVLTSMNDIMKHITYITPLPYISGCIREYDIKSANINMLLKYGKISMETYTYLSNLPKINREIEVGHMMKRDIAFYNTVSNGIKEAKKLLIESNNIPLSSIIRIANDAMYINSSNPLSYTKFDNIEFVVKHQYNCMLNLNNVIIFISLLDDGYNVDVIGMNNNNVPLHESFLSFICNLVYRIERVSYKDALDYYMDFYKSYVNKELDISYYREFNANSMYTTIGRLKYGMLFVNSLDNIDTGYNLYLLRLIYRDLLQMIKIR